jgi:hypothetical protein
LKVPAEMKWPYVAFLIFFPFLTFLTMRLTRSVTEFQIRSVDGHIEVHPIEDLEVLVTFIRTHGLANIAKVSFYITNPSIPDEIFRNVIVRNYDNLFIPEFCEASIEEDRTEEDWALVSAALRYGNLDDMFVQYIRTQNI